MRRALDDGLRQSLQPASRSSKPRDVRRSPAALSRVRRSRLTLFETAGCATWLPVRPRGRARSASRSSKPRDVRPEFWPFVAEVFGRLTLFETAGCATTHPDSSPVGGGLRLTLFETAGCATEIRGERFVAVDRPPHALRNRGMCDGERLVRIDSDVPPHALRNRGMCDGMLRSNVRTRRSSASRSSKPRDVRHGYVVTV